MSPEWFTAAVAVAALIVSAVTSWRQHRLARDQRRLTADIASRQEDLVVAHIGAQTAMIWREQVFMLHDRGLTAEEIRWIMCCEDGGPGHEEYNGIIDEIVRNVPRVTPDRLASIEKDPKRRLPRPAGAMRADLRQEYPFATHHIDPQDDPRSSRH